MKDELSTEPEMSHFNFLSLESEVQNDNICGLYGRKNTCGHWGEIGSSVSSDILKVTP